MAGTFQATISGKSAPLINLRDDDIYIDSKITTYNAAVADTASEILSTLVISTSVISNNRLSRRENLVPVLT